MFVRALLRSLAGMFAVVATLQCFIIGQIAYSYYQCPRLIKSLDDWVVLLLPVVAPLIAAAANVAALRAKRGSPTVRGMLYGFTAGANLLVAILTLYLVLDFQLIAHDGTAHWGMMFLPCLLVGVPAVLLGTLIGGTIGLLTHKTPWGNSTV